MARVLVVEDQKNMRSAIALMLRAAAHEVSDSPDGATACDVVRRRPFDLVLTDLRMGVRDGIDLLRVVKEVQPLAEVIVMTAYGTIENAVEAMRFGAADYLQKPFTEEQLLEKVESALGRWRLWTDDATETDEAGRPFRFANIIGRSPAIREIIARSIRVSPTEATVLITGESGTGKELIAKAIHGRSKRAEGPFVPLNCAAIHPELLESELFGHVRGAFTGAVTARKGLMEEAAGGTVFFDEIAEIPPPIQVKLLRAIQEREIRRVGDNKPVRVDVRFLAATNQNLEAMVERRAFREDLYYRLNVVRFHLPPLRDRREDIELLAEAFLDKFAQRMGRRSKLDPSALEYLLRYDYPGNVRELENIIQKGVALDADGLLSVEDVALRPSEQRQASRDTPSPPAAIVARDPDATLDDVIASAERRAIVGTLRELSGNKEASAERLGLSKTTLWRKMKRLGIEWPNDPTPVPKG